MDGSPSGAPAGPLRKPGQHPLGFHWMLAFCFHYTTNCISKLSLSQYSHYIFIDILQFCDIMIKRERIQWNWTFLGFETPVGNRPIRDWINALSEGAREELVDILLQIQVRPNDEWAAEHFKPLEDGISEIRFRTATHKFRIYGCFGNGQTYIMLVSTDEKVSNQKDAKRLAKDRRGQLQRREARTHPFSIET